MVELAPRQIQPEGDWTDWFMWSGRAAGSTTAATAAVMNWIQTGQAPRIALIGKTKRIAMENMVEGSTGLLRLAPEWPWRGNRSDGRLEYPGGDVRIFGAGDHRHIAAREFDAVVIDGVDDFSRQELDEIERCLGSWMRYSKNPRRIWTFNAMPEGWGSGRFLASGAVLQVGSRRLGPELTR